MFDMNSCKGQQYFIHSSMWPTKKTQAIVCWQSSPPQKKGGVILCEPLPRTIAPPSLLTPRSICKRTFSKTPPSSCIKCLQLQAERTCKNRYEMIQNKTKCPKKSTHLNNKYEIYWNITVTPLFVSRVFHRDTASNPTHETRCSRHPQNPPVANLVQHHPREWPILGTTPFGIPFREKNSYISWAVESTRKAQWKTHKNPDVCFSLLDSFGRTRLLVKSFCYGCSKSAVKRSRGPAAATSQTCGASSHALWRQLSEFPCQNGAPKESLKAIEKRLALL